MKTQESAKIKVLKYNLFKQFPEVLALTTTRNHCCSKDEFTSLNLGLHVGDDKKSVLANRQLVAESQGLNPERFTCPEQTHGDSIFVATEEDRGKGSCSWEDGIADTDALITNQPDLPLAILTADCAAAFLYDPMHNAIGIVHAGKKGTELEITTKTVRKMTQSFGTRPNNLLAVVSPCIHKCCYEINLPAIIADQLESTGVSSSNIEISEFCTSCNTNEFFSHRKEGGKTGRMMNLIMLRGNK